MLSPVFLLDTPPSLGLKASAFTLHGLVNQHYCAALQQRLQQLRNEFNPQHSWLCQAGFLDLRLRTGRSAKRFPPSPLTLYEQQQSTGRLRAVSPLVDLYNQWSLNSGLSIGAHDLQCLQLPVSLALSRGGESFSGLGSDSPTLLPAGEYAYFDARGQVLCRMEYRQANGSAVAAQTHAALFIVQGHPHTDGDYLRQIAEGLKADLQRYCSGLPCVA
ncbi:hypothetical protein HNE05_12060 [Aquipseudomonas campi]|uniref:B3/B4 tRNA-binding domain-containing protein n=1 Tax=Aquipseudomonas campi TaxID=2731681 RepID=A0A6M8FIC6_9GAMM|nr:phenylalanine--tRNA ligase beta subunit-related protein [Pseudomonas campi]QKE64052.1 hypothetical protein HNE05_12060 [Pseudomonas campi]